MNFLNILEFKIIAYFFNVTKFLNTLKFFEISKFFKISNFFIFLFLFFYFYFLFFKFLKLFLIISECYVSNFLFSFLKIYTTFYVFFPKEEPINVEAIACVGMNHFYADQPELSLRFYRRLLQMGVCNAELYNNLGLCCFYAQQFDMSLACMDRALSLTEDDETQSEVWYNIGHIALAMGDTSLAYQCFRLSLVANNSHAESFNNLGVLEMRRGKADSSKALFNSAASAGHHLFEPNYNLASLAARTGDLQTSYVVVKKSLALFPTHFESKELLERLNSYFSLL